MPEEEKKENETKNEAQTVPKSDLDALRSSKDKEIAAEKQKVTAAEQRTTTVEKQLEDLHGKDVVEIRKRLDVEKAALEERAKKVVVAELVQEYAKFGIKKEDLEKFSDPDQMEKFCLKSAVQKLSDGGSQDGEEDKSDTSSDKSKSRDTGESTRTRPKLEGLTPSQLLAMGHGKKNRSS